MNPKGQNPLASVERPKIDYPLTIAAAALSVVLLTGIVIAVRAGDLLGAVLFLLAVGLFVILILIWFASNRRTAAIDDRKFIHWDAAMPEVQRQNVNIEVGHLVRQLQASDDQVPELLSAFVVAEDLALRQIQQEEDLPLMRHVSIGSVPFDGILVDQDVITCIEVSFVVVPDVPPDRIQSILLKFATAKKNLAELKSRLRLRLMLVLVTQIEPEDEDILNDVLKKRRFNAQMEFDTVEIRLLDFETLQKLYLNE